MKDPPRKEYLLDLALLDVQGSKMAVLPYVAARSAVLIELSCPEILGRPFFLRALGPKQSRPDETKKNLETFNWQAKRVNAEHG